MQPLYHGSRVVVDQPEIRIQKFHKDFYWGFYCTSYEQQALRWATRFGKAGVVNVYSFDDQTELKIKRFLEMSNEWLDFIAACRNGVPHDYHQLMDTNCHSQAINSANVQSIDVAPTHVATPTELSTLNDG